MKYVSSIVMVVLFTLGVFAAEETRNFDKTFDVQPGSAFSIEFHKGKLNLTTGDTQEVVVQARVYLDGEGDPAMLDLVEIKANKFGNRVSVEVSYDKLNAEREWNNFWQKSGVTMPLVDFVVTIPDDADLEIESHKGQMEVQAPAGAIEVESHKGEGTFKNIRNAFEMETHKGSFKLEITRFQGLRISTHKGEVTADIQGADDFDLQADTHKGHLAFKGYDIPVEYGKKGRDGTAHKTIGSGRHKIRLDTHKGDIVLNFL